MKTHSTTILTVRHQGVVAMGGDGQVTVANTIMKADAVKIRRLMAMVTVLSTVARIYDGS